MSSREVKGDVPNSFSAGTEEQSGLLVLADEGPPVSDDGFVRPKGVR